ncbi:MAG: glycosyltransferase family 2 protein [Pseudomonadota bacterium]
MTGAAVNAVPTISVAVVTHKRPHLLPRALAAIALLDYPDFEIVVVGDHPTLDAYDIPPHIAGQIRYVYHAQPNICAARNHAVRASGGEIVAFIDDDAVPEQSWLAQLASPFANPNLAAASGSVRDADGMSFEWQGGWFDRSGEEDPLDDGSDSLCVSGVNQSKALRFLALRGVNAAFRRTALLQVGGFDEAIRYYLDETDIALRLADAGWDAAFVRHAEVHHLREANAQRGPLRIPGDQYEIGAAKGFFCSKHLPEAAYAGAIERFRRRRLADLDAQIRLGLIRAKDCDRITAQLADGEADGRQRQSLLPLTEHDIAPPFTPYGAQTKPLRIAVETSWGLRSIAQTRRFAASLAEAGHAVTCISHISGPWPSRTTFSNGFWLHSGGTWTRPAQLDGTPAITRRARALSEIARLSSVRHFDLRLSPDARQRPDAVHTVSLSRSGPVLAVTPEHDKLDDIEGIRDLLQSIADENSGAAQIEHIGVGERRPASEGTHARNA